MKVIAFFNMSGGVGKSTLTMNLSYHLAVEAKQRVLVIDVDPQASLTTFIGFNPFDFQNTIFQTLIEKTPLPIIKGVVWVDVVPANILLAQAELKLYPEFRREFRLADALEQVAGDYDVVLIDCPPSLGLLSINCLVASQYLLVPIQTEYKSVEATLTLLQTTHQIAQTINPKLRVAGAVPTMYDDRTSQAKRALMTIQQLFNSLREHSFFADAVVFPPIPRRTDFANATAKHQPVAQYSAKLDAIKTLQTISKALRKLP